MKKAITIIALLLFVLSACQQNTTPTYKIHFDASGGTGTMGFQYFNTYAEIPLNKNTFVYAGKSFIGWDMNDDATIEYTDGAMFKDTFSGAKTDVTLKAVWEDGYRITFDANGGTGTMDQQNITKDAADKYIANLNENTFERSGFLFKGWSESATGNSTIIEDKASYEATKQTTLYAQWY